MKYNLEFRQKVLSTQEKYGLTILETARRFDISERSINRWKKRIEAKSKPKNSINLEELKQDVEKYPDAYQYERAKRLGSSQSTVFRCLKELKISYKKNAGTPKKK
jgi:transposase